VSQSRIVLEVERETGGGSQLGDRWRDKCVNKRVLNLAEPRHRTAGKGIHALLRFGALVPVLETNKGQPITLSNAAKTEALDDKQIRDQVAFIFQIVAFNLLHDFHHALLSGTHRTLNLRK